MRKVNRGSLATPEAVKRKVQELCDASQQCTEEIADAYTVTVPAGFVPVRTLDLTSEVLTVDLLGAVMATFLMDLKQRGADGGRRVSNLTIRPAEPAERDVTAIYVLLLRMFDESQMQALNNRKAMIEIGRVCREEAAWVVEEDGELVASIGLAQAGLWYTSDAILHTRWLYALPDYRGHDGAFGLMVEEVKALCAATGMTAWLDVYNPLKATRKENRLEAAFRRFSFDPRGARMRLVPAEPEMEAA